MTDLCKENSGLYMRKKQRNGSSCNTNNIQNKGFFFFFLGRIGTWKAKEERRKIKEICQREERRG